MPLPSACFVPLWFRIASVRGLSGIWGWGSGLASWRGSSGASDGGVEGSVRWGVSAFSRRVLEGFLEVGGIEGFVTLLEVEFGPKARVCWARGWVVGTLRRVGGMVGDCGRGVCCWCSCFWL